MSILQDISKLKKEVKWIRNNLFKSGNASSSSSSVEKFQSRLVNTNVTANTGDALFVDTQSGSLNVLLPQFPSDGDAVKIIDGFTSFAANNLIIKGNGNSIQGLQEDLVCDINDAVFTLIYSELEGGWLINDYLAGDTVGAETNYGLFTKTIKEVEDTVTEYTITEEDFNKVLHFLSDSPVTVTVPNFAGNVRFEGKQMGLGQLSFAGDTGVSVNTANLETNKTASKYSVFGLDKTSLNEYVLFGNLELV